MSYLSNNLRKIIVWGRIFPKWHVTYRSQIKKNEHVRSSSLYQRRFWMIEITSMPGANLHKDK